MIEQASLLVADSGASKQIECNEILTNVTWETSILDQPGKLSFTLIDTGDRLFEEGSNVVFTYGGVKVFDGYVFTRNRSEGDTMTITAYDRIRYLNNQDTYVFENNTTDEIFATICKEHQLPYRIVSPSTYKTAPISHDNKTLYSMIIRALDETFIQVQKYIIVRDNVGTLELIDIANLVTDVFLGDESLMTKFAFSSSIDTDVYNYIKLVQENKKSKKREVYVAMDSTNINKWGRLQYFEKMDEDANEAQIKVRADQLLKLYNRKARSLKVTSLGNIKVREGSGVGVGIAKLSDEGIVNQQYAFVSKASHKFTNEMHTMDLNLEVV